MGLLGYGLFADVLVFLPEPFNSTFCIHQFLFTGVQRVTLGTDFQLDFATHGGIDFKLSPTSTSIGCGHVLRMDFGFHSNNTLEN